MLFSRYGSGASTVFEMPFQEGVKLIKYIVEQRTEDILLKRWMIHYEQTMSFSAFKEKLEQGRNQIEIPSNQEIVCILQELFETFGKEQND